jgi:signal transduction histidine kinase
MAPSFADLYTPDESAIARERARLLYEKLPFTLVSNLVIGIGLVSMLWHTIPYEWLLDWLVGLALLGVGRIWLWRKFRKIQATSFDPRLWFRLFTGSSLVAGSLVGVSGLLFFHEQPAVVLALAIFLGLISLGAVATHAAHRPAHLFYVLPAVLPFALRALAEQSTPFVVMGLGELLFLPITVWLSKRAYLKLVESIELRLYNQHLLAELTSQKKLAESAQRQAEQANAAKTRFFAAASHDMRQPVQALELFVAALGKDLKSSEDISLLKNIRSVGRELNEMLNTLLDFSRIDAAVIQPVVRNFPVADMLKQIADDFVPQAAAHGLNCRVVSSSIWVRSDPALLERVVRNFMNNAIKYTRRGKILLGCRRVGENLRIEVHDTGIGIAENYHKVIFNEFVQLDNPQHDRQNGLGLGLSIVDGLARLLGHPLTLRSQPQRGSMFAVTVPMSSPDALSSAESLPMEIDDPKQSAAILLVDDEKTIRQAATQLLENWGYAVVAAESTAQALALIRSSGFRPDLILVDYRLRKGRTGIETIRAIQSHCGWPVPAAIITGETSPESLVEAKASGFSLLFKPLSAAKLRALISNLLRS